MIVHGLVIASLGLAACAPQTPPPVDTGGPQELRARGVVRVVGSAPVNVQVVVHEPSGRSLRLDGPLAAEVGRLSGAEVEVWGDSAPRQGIEVTGYELHSVDGAPATVGVVERAADGGLLLRTATGVMRLSGGVGELRPGQKVWVQGPGTVQVQTYGVIRP
ncbi:MAG: hypothetical protein M3483_05630 [Gemmatimonadota bacterium]|nr:hypothetical protein [Gemmatimonadota bacterium]